MSIIWLIGVLFTYGFVDSVDNLSENPDKDTPTWFKFFAYIVMWPVLLGGHVGEMIEVPEWKE